MRAGVALAAFVAAFAITSLAARPAGAAEQALPLDGPRVGAGGLVWARPVGDGRGFAVVSSRQVLSPSFRPVTLEAPRVPFLSVAGTRVGVQTLDLDLAPNRPGVPGGPTANSSFTRQSGTLVAVPDACAKRDDLTPGLDVDANGVATIGSDCRSVATSVGDRLEPIADAPAARTPAFVRAAGRFVAWVDAADVRVYDRQARRIAQVHSGAVPTAAADLDLDDRGRVLLTAVRASSEQRSTSEVVLLELDGRRRTLLPPAPRTRSAIWAGAEQVLLFSTDEDGGDPLAAASGTLRMVSLADAATQTVARGVRRLAGRRSWDADDGHVVYAARTCRAVTFEHWMPGQPARRASPSGRCAVRLSRTLRRDGSGASFAVSRRVCEFRLPCELSATLRDTRNRRLGAVTRRAFAGGAVRVPTRRPPRAGTRVTLTLETYDAALSFRTRAFDRRSSRLTTVIRPPAAARSPSHRGRA